MERCDIMILARHIDKGRGKAKEDKNKQRDRANMRFWLEFVSDSMK
jgi:hypothetical protein